MSAGELLEGLDPEQREAVTAPPGPLAVIAPAGSGKTRVIAHRAAYAAREHEIGPERVLAISYTNRAVGEMRERIGSLLGEPGELVSCSTFHSLGAQIIRLSPGTIERSERFSIVAGSDSEAAMREALSTLGAAGAELRPRRVLSRIALAKALGEPPSALREKGLASIADAWIAYRGLLREADALDFGDLLAGGAAVLERSPEVRERFRRRFWLVLVDEYQDVNPVQQRMVEMLLGAQRNLTCVGDPRQAIMAYAGAEGRYLAEFTKLFEGAKVVELRTTYRCPQTVTGFAELGSGLRGGVRSAKGVGEEIEVGRYESVHEEARAVASRIAQLIGSEELRPGEIVVLTRTRGAMRALERELAGAGVPYEIVGGTGLLERAVVRDALAFCQLAYNPMHNLAAKRAAGRVRGLGAKTIERCGAFASERGFGLLGGFQRAREVPGLSEKQIAACGTMAGLVEEVARAGEERGVRESVRIAIRATRHPFILRAREDEEAKEELERLGELERIAAAHELRHSGRGDLGGFLEEVALVRDPAEGRDRVSVSTIHAAKGGEWRYVHIASVVEGSLPHHRALEEGAEAVEARLFYVAATRAAERLAVSTNGEAPESRFLAQAGAA